MLQVYENIKRLRLQKHMSQEELAEKVGYKSGKSMISKIESGKVDLTQSKIYEIADALGVDPGEIIGWDDPLDKLTQIIHEEGGFRVSNVQKITKAVDKEILSKLPKDSEVIIKEPKSDVDIIIEHTQNLNRDSLERVNAYINALIQLRDR